MSYYRRVTVLQVLWWLFVICLTSSSGCAAAQADTLAETIDRVVARAKSDGLLSGEIVIVDKDGETADQAFGLADREAGRQLVPGTSWLWASVTKQITAVLVMQLVEGGKLSLDGAINHYLPEFSGAHGGQVTIRQLLRHVSGLPNPDDAKLDINGVPDFYTSANIEAGNLSSALGYCSGPPKSLPDQKFEYNNCDYLVLGAILEKLSGQSFDDMVLEKIARPLGLRSVTNASNGMNDAATGYTNDGKRYPSINLTTFGAAGGLAGSANDLVRFDIALASGRLLSRESMTILWAGDPKLGYEALGVWSFPARLGGCKAPVRLIERRGDVGGIQVRNIISPDQGRAIAVFTNDDTVDFGEIWQNKGLAYDVLSAAFCASAGSQG